MKQSVAKRNIFPWGDPSSYNLGWGLPEPDFEYTGTSLVVIFRKSKLTEEYLKTLSLNNRQIKVIEFLKEHKRITSKKYADLSIITDRTARNDLRELIDKKVIKRAGVSDKTSYYILAEI
ncbi:MAG: DeoR family transcriptional regulator [Candidatus Omnitrophica bacterium]|nr:DeoR family transcriptional regulator [Candidatus Omnitrophota bacterium]